MVSICHSQCGQSPCILYIWIQRETIGFNRQRRAVAKDFECARKILLQRLLEVLTPLWGSRRQTTECKRGRSEVEARVQTAATVKTNLACVEFVKIVKNAAHRESLVIIQRLVHKTECNRGTIRH